MAVCAVTLLSHSATVPSSHLRRTCKSWPLEMCYPDQHVLRRLCMPGRNRLLTHGEQQLQKSLTLLVLQSLNPLRKSRVDKQGFLPRHGMYPNNGMSRDNRRPSHMFAISHCTFSLWKARMLSSQSFQQFLNWFREALVSCDLGYPSSISTGGGDLQECEDSDGWSLVLV
jgi:hypothetical protein